MSCVLDIHVYVHTVQFLTIYRILVFITFSFMYFLIQCTTFIIYRIFNAEINLEVIELYRFYTEFQSISSAGCLVLMVSFLTSSSFFNFHIPIHVHRI